MKAIHFFGKKHSKESRKKISEANKGRVVPREVVDRLADMRRGRKLSDEHRKKVSDNHADVSGKNNPNWKGGVTPKHMRIRTSKKYDAWRLAVYKRDNYTCQMCDRTKCKVIAHHIKPFATYEDERFNVSNGITLCKKCHTNIHKKWGYKYGEI